MSYVGLARVSPFKSCISSQESSGKNFSKPEGDADIGSRVGADSSDGRRARMSDLQLGKHLLTPAIFIGIGAAVGAVVGVLLLSNPLLLFGGAALGMAAWGALYLTQAASMRQGTMGA